LICLSVQLLYSSARAADGTVTGQVLINSEPADGAVVYVTAADGRTFTPMPVEKTIRQENIRFNPDFLIIPAGSTIRFENHDDEVHNIYSKAPENRFDTGAHLPHTVKTVTLKNPGAVPIRCRTHPTMRGMIFVTPSAFFSPTDAQGRFEIRDLPPGRYRVTAWNPRLSPEEQAEGAIDLELNAAVRTVELRFRAQAPKGSDLTGTSDRDWRLVVNQIQEELEKAVNLWKKGAITPATAKVMSAQSRLYGESGLRNAIAERLGKTRADVHERHLDAFRKRIQGIGGEETSEAVLRQEASLLINGLTADVKKISAP
jgi:plastocyanin